MARSESETPAQTPSPPSAAPSRRSRWGRFLRRRLWIYPLLYVVLCLLLFVFQRSIQYPADGSPVPMPPGAAAAGLREVQLTAADGVELLAWYQPGRRDATIVVFHGNGGHRGWRHDWMQNLRAQGPGVFLLDYRGYGGSEGSPSEEGLYHDAEAALAWVREHAPGPIILFGESLGTGVAVEMAGRHETIGLILHAAFTSTVDVASSMMFFAPVSLLMLDRFESVDKIGDLACPKLFLHGREDRVIPIRFGHALFAAAAEPKKFIDIPGAGHNDLHVRDLARYYGEIRTFIDDVLGQN